MSQFILIRNFLLVASLMLCGVNQGIAQCGEFANTPNGYQSNISGGNINSGDVVGLSSGSLTFSTIEAGAKIIIPAGQTTTLSGNMQSGIEIWIEEGSELFIPDWFSIKDSTKIYVLGTLHANNLKVETPGELYVNGTLNCQNTTFTLQGGLLALGSDALIENIQDFTSGNNAANICMDNGAKFEAGASQFNAATTFIYTGSSQPPCLALDSPMYSNITPTFDPAIELCLSDRLPSSSVANWETGVVNENCESCATGVGSGPCSSNVIFGIAQILGVPINSGQTRLIKQQQNGEWKVIDNQPLDENGTFEFTAVDSGQYLVRIVADKESYPLTVPTFYPQKLQWESAALIGVNCEDTINLVAEITELTAVNGASRIAGVVYYSGFNKTTGDPIPGLDIVLEKTPPNVIIAHTSTNDQGAYEFLGIEAGDYYVHVDIPGLEQIEGYTVTVDDVSDTVETGLNFFADTTHAIFTHNVVTSVPTVQLENAIVRGRVIEFPSTIIGAEYQFYELTGRELNRGVVNGRFYKMPETFHGLILLEVRNQQFVLRQKIVLNR